MKRTVVIAFLIGCVFSVAGAGAQSAEQNRLDALMAKWLRSLNTENIADYSSCYWNDATVLTYDTKGSHRMLRGINAIRANQQNWFDGADYASFKLTYPQPDRFSQGMRGSWVYVYNNIDRYRYMEAFYFEERSGEYRIVHQLLVSNLAIP